MPIQILAPHPPTFGPGLRINLQSSVISSGATGVTWTVDVFGGPEERNLLHQVLLGQSNVVDGQLGLQPQGGFRIPDFGVQAGTGITVQIHAEAQSTGEIDTGTSSAFTWQPEMNAWALTSSLQTGGGQGGLTAEQAAQLQRTDTNTTAMDVNWQAYEQITLPSLQQVLDGITAGITARLQDGAAQVEHTIGDLLSWVDMHVFPEQDLSGGTICTPFRYDASLQNLQSLTVYIDSWPPEFHFVTPDAAWSFRDLAVLTFRRGNATIERHGIHTLTYTVSRLPQSIGPWPLNIRFDVQPTDYHIAVDWAPGVCGHIVASVRP